MVSTKNEPQERRGGSIGIVTVTFNSGNVLADFLRSLETQTLENFRIWAIDNASTDNSVSQLKAWNDPRLEIVANDTNVGVAAANNQGIVAALAQGYDYILLVNNDVFFGPDLLDRLVRGLDDYSCSMTVP